jgi:hypothetical protein
LPRELLIEIVTTVNGRARDRIASVLRNTGVSVARSTVPFPIVSFPEGIEAAVSDYVARLSTAVNSEVPLATSAIVERYTGRREVIEELLPLLEVEDALEIRAGLDAVLFNVGVRPLCTVGDTVPFDPRLHQSKDAVSPAQSVRVSHAGWALGDNDEQIVLSKARVETL